MLDGQNLYVSNEPFLITKFDCIALDAASMYFQVAFRGPWKLGLKNNDLYEMAAVHYSQCAVFLVHLTKLVNIYCI